MKKKLFILLMIFALSCSKNNEGSIVGTASTNDGAVVSDITVKLFDMNVDLISQTKTDAEGNFYFGGLNAGNYYVGATITIDGEIWDTASNKNKLIYMGGETQKKVALILNKK